MGDAYLAAALPRDTAKAIKYRPSAKAASWNIGLWINLSNGILKFIASARLRMLIINSSRLLVLVMRHLSTCRNQTNDFPPLSALAVQINWLHSHHLSTHTTYLTQLWICWSRFNERVVSAEHDRRLKKSMFSDQESTLPMGSAPISSPSILGRYECWSTLSFENFYLYC